MEKRLRLILNSSFLFVFGILLILSGCNKTNDIEILSQEYYPNGEKKTEIVKTKTSSDDSRCLRYEYYDSGNLACIYESTFTGIGEIEAHGEYFCLYRNGDTVSKGQYEHGKLVGQNFQYFKAGRIATIDQYDLLNEFSKHYSFREDSSIERFTLAISERPFYSVEYDSLSNPKKEQGSPLMLSPVMLNRVLVKVTPERELLGRDTIQSLEFHFLIGNAPSLPRELILLETDSANVELLEMSDCIRVLKLDEDFDPQIKRLRARLESYDPISMNVKKTDLFGIELEYPYPVTKITDWD